MKPALASLFCLCSLASPALAGNGLLHGLVDALNSKDQKVIRAFLDQNASAETPLDQRLKLMQGLAEQAAPFSLIKDLPGKVNEQDAVLTMRDGTRLVMQVGITNETGEKINNVLLLPAYRFEGPDPSLANWTALPDLQKTLLAQSGAPAMSIAVMRDGKVEEAAGGLCRVGDTAQVQPGQVWSIGSIGKSICATVIGKLIEQGKLHWDETLADALPDIPMKMVYEDVTIEQLMHHRGGVPEDLSFDAAKVEQIVGPENDPTRIRNRYARDILLRDSVAKPGEQFVYSNAGYALLGHIAERAAGEPYEQLVRDLVFTPLGLNDSYTDADSLPVNRPHGHVLTSRGLEPAETGGVLDIMLAPAGGGIYMSLPDLLKYGNEHLKGLQGKDGLLKAATMKRLHKGMKDSEGASYACGWNIESVPGIETFHGHNGSNGTFEAELAIFPKAGLIVAAATNCGNQHEPSTDLEAVFGVALKYTKR